MFTSSSLRKGLLTVHLWLGLFLGLYFSVVGITGSLLVFQDNLQSWQTPEIAYCAPPSPSAQLLPLSELISRVRASSLHPSDDDLAHILMPDKVGGAYRIQPNVMDADKRRVVSINPYTGQVIRDQLQKTTLLGFAHNLHVFLLLGAPGELANGVGGVLVAFLLLSGLWLWWPRTVKQLRSRLTVKKRAGLRRLLLDWHQVFGIYSFALLFIIAVTGALFVFPQPVQAIIARLSSTGGAATPRRGKGRAAAIVVPPGARRLPIEKLVAIAEPIDADIAISSLNYPTAPDQPFSCYKRSFRPGFLPYVNISIDPYSGKVLLVNDDRAAPLAAKIPRVLSMLHFGLWGGLLMKSVYALVGLVPSGLFLTGVLLWWKKKRAAWARSAASPATTTVPA